MKCFIYWTADLKSSKLWSSQLWLLVLVLLIITISSSSSIIIILVSIIIIIVIISIIIHIRPFHSWKKLRKINSDDL